MPPAAVRPPPPQHAPESSSSGSSTQLARSTVQTAGGPGARRGGWLTQGVGRGGREVAPAQRALQQLQRVVPAAVAQQVRHGLPRAAQETAGRPRQHDAREVGEGGRKNTRGASKRRAGKGNGAAAERRCWQGATGGKAHSTPSTAKRCGLVAAVKVSYWDAPGKRHGCSGCTHSPHRTQRSGNGTAARQAGMRAHSAGPAEPGAVQSRS